MSRPDVLTHDDALLVKRLPGTGRRLVLAFTGLQQGLGGVPDEEFIGVASNGGRNHVLFISDLTCSWYSRDGLIGKITDLVRAYIAENTIAETVTIGNSMGGYGAILFAGHLPVSKVIAFVPQVSMDLGTVLDTRWMQHREHFGADLPPSLRPIIERAKARFFLFFGADNAADADHARLLPALDRVAVFTLEGTGHEVASRLKQLGLLAPVVADIMENDGAGLGGLLAERLTSRSGHCLCGAVGFTIAPLNPEVGACHCKMCQRWAGSALLAMETPAEAIRFTGQEHIRRYRSSDWAERAWCNECGSALWYRLTTPGSTPHPYEIPIGLLDDTSGLTMAREIYVDNKAPVVAFTGQHEKLTEAECIALYAGSEE